MSNARFSIVPAWIITDSRLKGSDLKVLCLLGSFTNKEGWCRRSQVKMAGELGCSRSSVQASLNRLYQIGVVEKRQVDSVDGRDSSHYYRVIHDRSVSDTIMAAWSQGSDDEEFGPIVSAGQGVTPATLMAPPATIVAPPALLGGHPLPSPEGTINDTSLTNSSNERERRAREIEEEEGDAKSLHKRYRALEIGKSNNPWPGVLSSGGDWGFRQFVNLTPEERLRAEDRRDAYLAACPKIGGGKRKGEPDAPPLGVYLRDKRFDLVDAIVPKQARNARPEMIPVAPFGPIWGGLRAMSLLGGVEAFDIPLDLRDGVVPVFEALRKTSEASAIAYLQRKGISLAADGEFIFPDDFEREEIKRRQRDSGYPEVNRLHRQAKSGEGGSTEAKYAIFSELCEPVPVASELFQVWKAHDEDRGWPVVPDPGRQRVVYFPKGGPGGLAEFHRAALAAGTAKGRGDEHAA